MSSETSEFEELVFLETLSQSNVVEVVETVYRVTERLVVFLFNKQLVVRFVNGIDIELHQYVRGYQLLV